MSKLFTNATLVLADRLLPGGWLLEEQGKIVRYGSGAAPEAEEIVDCGGKYLSPGFIDVHCHGGGGGSFMSMDLQQHIKAMKMHLQHGVTALTPTPGTINPEEIRCLREIKEEIDPAVYDEQCGMMEMVMDIDDIASEMSAIRADYCKYL